MPLLFYLLAAAIGGLAVASVSSVGTTTAWIAILLCLSLAFYFRCFSRFPRLSLLLTCLAVSFFFNSQYAARLQFVDDVTRIDQLSRRTTAVGVITDVRQLTDGRSRIDLLIDEVWDKQQALELQRPLRLRLSVEEGGTNDAMLPRDRIRFTGRLRQPRLFGTPGEFHWPRYVISQNIDMTSWVKNIDQVALVAAGEGGLRRSIVQWRIRVAGFIAAKVPAKSASLVRALVLGEGRQLPEAVRETLAGAGVSHLFAISGLHLGILGAFGYRLLLTFYRRSTWLLNWQPPQRVLPLLLLPLLFVYLLLTGDAVSTRRAFALAGIGSLLFWWRYPVHPLHLLAAVALIFLLYNPLLLWSASWQLSFCGAAGILLWRPWWQHAHVSELPWTGLRYLVQIFLVSLAATLATLPLVLFNFHLFAPAALVANLICVPIVTLVALPVGFVGLFLFPLWPPAAALLFRVSGFFLEQLYQFSLWLTDFSPLAGNYLYWSRSQYLAVALLLVPALLFPQLARRPWLKLTVGCLLSAVLLWQLPLGSHAPVTLTMFSVGQGESLLLQNNTGQNILIDGGGLYGDRFDVGQRLLAPAFGELGVQHFDRIILTHDHADHWKGLVYVLERFPVAELVVGEPLEKYHPVLVDAVRQRNVPVRVVEPGWSSFADWQEGTLEIYNAGAVAANANDASLVLSLRTVDATGREQGMLLAGDLEAQGVQRLMAAGIRSPATLLKLPHHGSGKSQTERLFSLLGSGIGLVSVGYQNVYRLPSKTLLEHLEEEGLRIYRTDLDGTVRVQLDDAGWRPQKWQNGLFR
ncbi:DNA internalization-related competence protein ComEC/Rec2 [Pelovirga terrestris]|uniref:DNA internalization-related competence protein ComEC/Rec2 n=1 Tax=Pelovirga terrestris TaxID=2771352 RepID=A0A8J6QQP7_9BACT|nr:DNA internalization-related competence protein ComEC/Rec2 [Pelovirga terrestris]MBD1401396.1 DNA internalization-related competence protein ComEC/Rec2 [Pelovirga terrestris]